MGQYYKVVNLTKRQFINPHRFGDGVKLLEFGSSGEGTLLGLTVLLAHGNGKGGGDLRSDKPVVGSWAGDQIVITGDYADEADYLTEDDIRAWRKHSLKQAALNQGDFDTTEDYKREVEKIQKAVPNLYDVVCDLFEDVSGKVILALADDEYIRTELMKKDRWDLNKAREEGLSEKVLDPKMLIGKKLRQSS